MKYIVVGFCGSMGRRRVRCLKALGIDEIYGFDISKNAYKIANELNIKMIESLEDVSEATAIISTPPKNHIEYINMFLSKKCHVFCEASVVPEDRLYYEKIKEVSIKNNVTFFPSATIKFKDSIIFIKNLIEESRIGDVLSYDYRFAQNLRTWHPYQDINDFYVSDPGTGAGREMAAFELSWLTWLFGIDYDVLGASVDKLSEISIETKIDDFYSFIIRHTKKNIVGNTTIDVFSHKPYRVLRIAGTDGNVEFDWIKNKVDLFNSDGTLVSTYSEEDTSVEEGYTQFSTEKMYVEEIKNFISSVNNPQIAKCKIDDDFKVLSCVKKIERLSGR